MQVCILLALLGTALAASDPVYWEPGADSCYCVGCSDPWLLSFDGAILDINDTKKTAISMYGKPDHVDDICKFGFRVVTKADIDGIQSALHYDWVGWGYGQNDNPDKNWRNFLMGQDVNGYAQLGLRGQGYEGVAGPVASGDFPYSTHQADPNKSRECEWQVDQVGNSLELRSTCCQYRFNWHPAGENTCWELWVGPEYQDGTLGAMCGDCNNDNINDFRLCPRGAVVPVVGHLPEIDTSCTSGQHQGWFFQGGTRLGDE